MQRISLIAMAVVYIAAGANHFWHPHIYLSIMPDYFPAKSFLNLLAGSAEMVLGSLLFFRATRQWAAYGIIALLLLFLPVHIWMVAKGGCYFNPAHCIPAWLLWLRLLVGQPLLVVWAWSNRK
jgi:uncharacterized membrane protein